MKSYTDLEQSKKLEEILPLESADMSYSAITGGMRDEMIIKDWEVTIGLDPAIKNNLFSYRNGYVFPCWSLAALLDVLPKQIGRYTKTLYWFDDAWHCEYIDEDSEGKYGVTADNPVDACHEMILKLHELKML